MPDLVLSYEDEMRLLYYEPGMTQMVPDFEIISWMKDQGYVYDKDWFCRLADDNGHNPYVLFFPNAEIMSAFLIRWL